MVLLNVGAAQTSVDLTNSIHFNNRYYRHGATVCVCAHVGVCACACDRVKKITHVPTTPPLPYLQTFQRNYFIAEAIEDFHDIFMENYPPTLFPPWLFDQRLGGGRLGGGGGARKDVEVSWGEGLSHPLHPPLGVVSEW